MKPILTATILVGLSVVAARAQAPQTAPAATITIRAATKFSETGGGTAEITETFPGVDFAAGEPMLSLGVQAPGMTAPQRVEHVTLRDDAGDAPVALIKNGGGDDDLGRQPAWTSTRAIHGSLTVRYSLPIVNDNSFTGGPPVYPRIDGDGFSSVGTMLIMQPKTKAPYRVRIHWDLAAMGPGAQGVSTFGDGDVELGPGPLARLSDAAYLAGHIQRQPQSGGGAFAAVWTGAPTLDVRPPLQWAQTLHLWYSRFFGDKAEPFYRIFLRSNPAANAGGGAAFPHSFMWTYGEGVEAEHLKAILGHEMTHTWTANSVGRWYNEGNAVYYQVQLPWRAGMLPTQDYLADINLTAARYYTNDLIHATDAEVSAKYWSDVRLIVIPYDRGAIYFAALDAKLRKASGGKRTVDDLIRAMVQRDRDGKSTDEAAWLEVVGQALGPQGVADEKAMMAGALQLPDSDAYGPCFRRVDAKIRRYDLGYDQNQAKTGKVVGLEPGSEAAKAGVREGDQIVLRTNTDGHQRDPAMMLTVKIIRDGKTFPITYLPRGAEVASYQWVRTAAPESACRR